jgi:hypothetical protein
MPIISVRDLVVEYDGRRVLNGLNLDKFPLAAFRTSASPCDTPFPLCVGYVLG